MGATSREPTVQVSDYGTQDSEDFAFDFVGEFHVGDHGLNFLPAQVPQALEDAFTVELIEVQPCRVCIDLWRLWSASLYVPEQGTLPSRVGGGRGEFGSCDCPSMVLSTYWAFGRCSRREMWFVRWSMDRSVGDLDGW